MRKLMLPSASLLLLNVENSIKKTLPIRNHFTLWKAPCQDRGVLQVNDIQDKPTTQNTGYEETAHACTCTHQFVQHRLMQLSIQTPRGSQDGGQVSQDAPSEITDVHNHRRVDQESE